MHNSVIEVSTVPIPEAERAKGGNLPDWFFEQVCDYTTNLGLAQRWEVIRQFHNRLGDLCVQNGDMLTISPQIRETYFRKSYVRFKTAAEALMQMNYEVFAGIKEVSVFYQDVDALNSACEDRRGTYIYSPESGELVTLDRWLRVADLSRPFYIGGTIHYHY